MDPQVTTPLMIGAFVLWAIYRRVRRNVGRQRVQPRRMTMRVGLLGLVGALSLLAYAHNIELAGALLGGLIGGAALAMLGLRHTKFEATAQGKFYTPHTFIGLFVSGLLLARIAYRFAVVFPVMHAAHQANANPFAAYQKSPLTLAIFGIVVGYYVAYYVGVLVVSAKTESSAPPDSLAG